MYHIPGSHTLPWKQLNTVTTPHLVANALRNCMNEGYCGVIVSKLQAF